MDPEIEQIVAQKRLEKGCFDITVIYFIPITIMYCTIGVISYNLIKAYLLRLREKRACWLLAPRLPSLRYLVIKKHKEDKHGSQTSSSNFINVKMFFSTEQKCAYYILVVS